MEPEDPEHVPVSPAVRTPTSPAPELTISPIWDPDMSRPSSNLTFIQRRIWVYQIIFVNREPLPIQVEYLGKL